MELTYDPGVITMPDQETFARVWQRVMPDQSRSPIQPNTPPPSPSPRQPSAPELRKAPPPTPLSETALLEQLMDQTALAAQHYQALARRPNSHTARSLSRCAAACQQQLRRLSAAYFLISAARYQPWHGRLHPTPPSMDMALREQFLREQRQGTALRAAIGETNDPCLGKLCTELAGESDARCDILRGLLEQM